MKQPTARATARPPFGLDALGRSRVSRTARGGPARSAGDGKNRAPRHGIHVAVVTGADVDRLWELTQDPAVHARWDVRFGRIEPTTPGAFTYRRFGVSGTGTHAGERRSADGGATSALTFACPKPLSPIEVGSGYWRYRPLSEGTSFETGYDYRCRYPVLDRLFRPAMAWGTAWSFDRLRLWADRGVAPELSLALALLEVAARTATVLAVVLLLAAAGPAAATAGALAVVGLLLHVPALPWRPSAGRTTWSWQPAATTDHRSASRPEESLR